MPNQAQAVKPVVKPILTGHWYGRDAARKGGKLMLNLLFVTFLYLALSLLLSFDSLILQQHDDFSFAGRSRRPPLDNTNALLSFAYSLLASDCTAALQSVGLDPYVGFLHRARPGRRSLALDLMEELRAVYADRFVLSCINQKIMTPKHFQKQENGAVLLTDEGRRAFLGGWQTRKQ